MNLTFIFFCNWHPQGSYQEAYEHICYISNLDASIVGLHHSVVFMVNYRLYSRNVSDLFMLSVVPLTVQ